MYSSTKAVDLGKYIKNKLKNKMDSITQAVLGAAIGEAVLGKKIGKKGAIAGAVIATIPDLDTILYLFYNSFQMLSIHRGISHSVIFSIIAGLLIALILSKTAWFKKASFQRIFIFTWLCLFTHSLLDTFTAYGTQLLLPFSNKRLGFDSVNIVDPVYTLPLIFGLILSLKVFKGNPNRAKYNLYGLLISSCYLLLTLFNKQIIQAKVEANMLKNNIKYQSLMTMPVGIANLNWYGVAKNNDSLYLQKCSLLFNENNKIEAFPVHEAYLNEIDTHAANIMRWFAKGFYTVEKIDGRVRIYNLQVDMRGVVKNGNTKAPTKGYFEIENEDTGAFKFSSGTIKN